MPSPSLPIGEVPVGSVPMRLPAMTVVTSTPPRSMPSLELPEMTLPPPLGPPMVLPAAPDVSGEMSMPSPVFATGGARRVEADRVALDDVARAADADPVVVVPRDVVARGRPIVPPIVLLSPSTTDAAVDVAGDARLCRCRRA